MNDDIKQENTNRYSTRLRTSHRQINYAEDYSELNYDSESSDDNRIYSRRINLNSNLSKSRKRRKIYNEKDSSIFIKLERDTNNYNNCNNNDNIQDNNLNDNENVRETEDDNDTVNESVIEDVENNINKNNQNNNINEAKSSNISLSNSTKLNHHNTRYNTFSHYKEIVKPISSYIKSSNEGDYNEYMKRKNNNDNEYNNENGYSEDVNDNKNQSEARNDNQLPNNKDLKSKIIEDDLENSFDIHRRGRPRRKKIILEDQEQDEENQNNHYNLRNRSHSNTIKPKVFEDYEDQNDNSNEKEEYRYKTRYATRYATRHQTRYSMRYTKLHSADNDEEEKEVPSKMYLRKPSLELKNLVDHQKDEMLESRKVGNYNLRRSDQTINYSLPSLIENAHKHIEKSSRNQRHRLFINRSSSSSYSYRKKRSYSYRDKSDSEDERKNLFVGRAPRRIGLGGNGLRGDDDDNGRSIVPMNIKELLLAEQKVLQQLNLSSNPNDNEILKNMLTHDGQNIADTDQVDVKPVDFNMIGGLNEHIQSLKEMVILPLLYPEVYSKFSITPPRGVLFHGPPGTGKTLLARALASSCSTQNQKVAFFMRKGADCLTKWVGESERQLKLLFEEAKIWQPSIIFFDEIDGLAPVRSSKQDQIHSSIVTTLLSLMDGLDKRGQVVVIGATNRIDSIDPALRRPGRFDREFYFPLPNIEARKKIIEINTKSWSPPLEPKVIDQLASITKGYCGADVKALCTEAAIHAMKKTYPQIYDSREKLLINTDDIVVNVSDFLSALKSIKPSTFRSSTGYSREIPNDLMPLFRSNYTNIISILDNIIPIVTKERKHDWEINEEDDFKSLEDSISSYENFDSRLLSWDSLTNIELKSYQIYRLRLLICGEKGMGQTNFIGPAIVNKLENWGFFIKSFDLNTLLKESYQTIESTIISSFQELSRHSPVAIYIPNIDIWWNSVSDLIKNIFLMNLEDFESKYPVFFLATCNQRAKDIPEILKLFNLIPNMDLYNLGIKRVYEITKPSMNEIKDFFKNIIDEIKEKPKVKYIPIKSKITNKIIGLKSPKTEIFIKKENKVLPKAPPPPPREFTKDELDKIHEHDEYVLAELRRELRTMTKELRKDKELKVFCYPVDLSEAEDYLECIEQPMDFSKIDEKIDNREYNTPKEWYEDIELIVNNAMTYNQNYDPNNIIRKAKILKDNVKVMMHFLNPELVWECNQVIRHRKLEEIQNKKNNKNNENNSNNNSNNANNRNHTNNKHNYDTITEVVNKYQFHNGAPGTRQSRRLLGQKPDLDIVSFENLKDLRRNKHNNNNNNKDDDNDNDNVKNDNDNKNNSANDLNKSTNEDIKNDKTENESSNESINESTNYNSDENTNEGEIDNLKENYKNEDSENTRKNLQNLSSDNNKDLNKNNKDEVVISEISSAVDNINDNNYGNTTLEKGKVDPIIIDSNDDSFETDMDDRTENINNIETIKNANSPKLFQLQHINDENNRSCFEKEVLEDKIVKPIFELDIEKLQDLENRIYNISSNLSIEMIQYLSSELTHLVTMKKNEWNRDLIIKDAMKIVNRFKSIHQLQ
ncbi:AAA-domain-containing protein [Piromyces finnis]|uniref:AAA-domain-containing protein n=1 Tax=Piromyces finnis TaxID=1754191 RepID=A0A1Y1V123_9FUNG|nr:AAA-domain-containing protein [Piromyces finnis]|eukprot:ORX44975.1 AAA-domain-containing protein [Piromyces finnis]